MLVVPLLVLTPRLPAARARPPAGGSRSRSTLAFLLLVELATLSRSGLLGLGVGLVDPRAPVPAPPALARVPATRSPPSPSCSRRVLRPRRHFFSVVLRSRVQTGGAGDLRPLQRLLASSRTSSTCTRFRARAEQLLGLLRVRHGQVELGPALVLRRAARRDRHRRHRALRALPLVGLPPPARRPRARPGARRRRRPARRARAAARVGDDRRARRDDGGERLLPDDAVLLLLRLPGPRAGAAARLPARGT